MSNEQEIIQALEETIVNTENVNQDYKKVLTTTGEVDVTLADGSTTPNLNKRVRTVIGEVPMITDGNVSLEDGGNQREFNTFVKKNGAALPWMPGVEYVEGAPVVKDGVLVQKSGDGWKQVGANKASDILDDSGLTQQQINDGLKVEMVQLSNSKANTSYVDEKVAAVAGGLVGSYLTYDEAILDKENWKPNTFIQITNDPDPSKNGQYTWDGATITKSDYDPLQQAYSYTDSKIRVVNDEIELNSPKTTKIGYVKTLDSGKVWLWDRGEWTDTGLSELDRANIQSKTDSSVALHASSTYLSNLVGNPNNLFNPILIDKGIFSSTNHFEPSDSYWVSSFIRVDSSKEYERHGGDSVFSKTHYVYVYDSNFKPIKLDSGNNIIVGFDGKLPVETAYVRLVFNAGMQNNFSFQEKSKEHSTDLLLNNSVVFSDHQDKYVVDDIVLNQRLFAEKIINLFDKTDLVPHPVYPGFFITSHMIRVECGVVYKKARSDFLTDSHHVIGFNKAAVQIKQWETRDWYSKGVEIPEGVQYVKIVADAQSMHSLMFVDSSVDTSKYIDYLIPTKNLINILKNNSQSDSVHAEVDLIGSVDYQSLNTDLSHIISYGQSLSTGQEADRALTTSPVDRTFMIGNSVWINSSNNLSNTLYPLVASTTDSGMGENPIVSATQTFRLLLDRYLPANKIDLIATSAGASGMSIEQLSKESTNGKNWYNANFLSTLDRSAEAAKDLNKSISCSAIVWMQGEYNYTHTDGAGLEVGTNATRDKDTYKKLLMKLKNNMQNDVLVKYKQKSKPLFFMYQVAGSFINDDTMPINIAMIEFEAENDDVIFMNPTYQVPDHDAGHLSANGYRWYGQYIAKQLSASLLHQKSSVVCQIRATYMTAANSLRIDCQVPNPPLISDTWTTYRVNSLGFKVWDDSGELGVSGVELRHTSIILKFSRNSTGTVHVSYAGKDRAGSGNIRDSDRYASHLKYISDVGFRPPYYTPKTSDGEVLDNKKLPMHNWLVAFYQKVDAW